MNYSLLTQLVLLGAACVIIFTYVMPKFQETKVIQDDLFSYNEAVEKAAQYNARLRELLSVKESFPQDKLVELERFIPLSIDEVAIMHELEAVFYSKAIPVTSLTMTDEVSQFGDAAVEQEIMYAEDGSEIEADELTTTSNIYQRDFKVVFASTYGAMKDALSIIEANPSLLEVVDFSLKQRAAEEVEEGDSNNEDPILAFEVTVRAYGLTPSIK